MKSLVIVGSAPLEEDYSGVIDSADCVMRFNNCKNYNQNSGTRTDILVLNCWGNNPTLQFLVLPRSREEIDLDLPYVSMCREVWFIRPEAAWKTHYDGQITSSNIVEALAIPADRVRRITPAFYSSIREKLCTGTDKTNIVPSTGLLGIELALVNPVFKDYSKILVGFRWRGWKGHSWKQEAKVVDGYLKQGLLKQADAG